MALAAVVSLACAKAYAEGPDPLSPTRTLAERVAVERSALRTAGGYGCGGAVKVAKFRERRGARTTNGTVTCLPEGAITAAHVAVGAAGLHRRPTRHDMVWLDRRRPLSPRRPLEPGDRVTIVGFAEHDFGSPQRRHGAVLRAWKPGEWLVRLDDGQSPVRNGMSGGAVLDSDGQVRGIVITRNRKVDLDGDGRREHSSVVVDLAAWNAAAR